MKTLSRIFILVSLGMVSVNFSSCNKSMNNNTTAVTSFNQQKYLGTWYEIARLDYSYEKDLDNVSANYSMVGCSNKIIVDNKGYDVKEKKWKESVGTAKSAGNPSVGKLKVSFFRPFYSEYTVVAIDKDYIYALVAGKNNNYLWFLARSKTMPEDVKQEYIAKAKSLGYNTDNLIWVHHDQ
jgi:apolipoprotein D and lipocalin family protein